MLPEPNDNEQSQQSYQADVTVVGKPSHPTVQRIFVYATEFAGATNP